MPQPPDVRAFVSLRSMIPLPRPNGRRRVFAVVQLRALFLFANGCIGNSHGSCSLCEVPDQKCFEIVDNKFSAAGMDKSIPSMQHVWTFRIR